MDQAQALAIVRSLANGVDPESGEVFPPESAYQRPQVVRALYVAAAALERIGALWTSAASRCRRTPARRGPRTRTASCSPRLTRAGRCGSRPAHERTMGAVRARF